MTDLDIAVTELRKTRDIFREQGSGSEHNLGVVEGISLAILLVEAQIHLATMREAGMV